MARARQVLVSNSATELAGPDLTGGSNLFITNPTGAVADVYLGGEGNTVTAPGQSASLLTSTTGYLLKVGQAVGPIRLAGNEKVYAVTNTATSTVYVFQSEGRP